MSEPRDGAGEQPQDGDGGAPAGAGGVGDSGAEAPDPGSGGATGGAGHAADEPGGGEPPDPADAGPGDGDQGAGGAPAGRGAPAPAGRLATWLAARGTRWGTATGVYVVVAAAILVGVNLVGSRVTAGWDVTAQHLLTLSSASRRIAGQVKHTLNIIAFTQPGDPTGSEIRVLLAQYARSSHGRITYQVVDPVTHVALAQRYGVQAYNTVVVQSGANVQTVQPTSLTTYNSAGNAVFDGETAITNAILRAGAASLQVDWLEGDGEPDIASGRHPDATQALRNMGYKVSSVNLLTSNGIPANVAAVVIDSPTRDLSVAEIATLNRYASAGGHLIVLLPPLLKPLPRLDALLASWGIKPQNDVVIDLVRHYQSDPTQIVPHYASSPITTPIQQANMATLLPGAQGLTLSPPKGYQVQTVLETTAGGSKTAPKSWGMTNLTALQKGQINYTLHSDFPGPVTVAATTEASPQPAAPKGPLPATGAPGFRAVVFGNSYFISSGSQTGGQGAYITIQGNEDLFLNAVGWATGQSQGITVRPNPSLSTQVFLSAGATRSLVLTFVAGIPLLCFVLAIGTWVSRRRL